MNSESKNSGTAGLRWVQCSISGAPSSSPTIICCSVAYSWSKRRMKPTWTRRRPSSVSRRYTAAAVVASVVSGFSHSTGLPASRQARTCSSCAVPGLAITTASTSSAAIAASGSATTRAPIGSATRWACSSEKSLITVTRAPRVRRDRLSTWNEPILPTPRTATFSSPVMVASYRAGVPMRTEPVPQEPR